jgi:hypothetical protein
MNKYIHDSKAKQVSAAQKTQKDSQTATVTEVPTHKEIARRAYEIYLENGRKQGQSEQYWLQAEQELKNRKHWRQAEEE